MKHRKIGNVSKQFAMLASSPSCQAAKMILKPGAASEDHPSNEHRRSEQWLFVIDGIGIVRAGQKRTSTRQVKIQKGSLLYIQKGELHQVRNPGRRPLITLNFYIPPAYDTAGKPLRRHKK